MLRQVYYMHIGHVKSVVQNVSHIHGHALLAETTHLNQSSYHVVRHEN